MAASTGSSTSLLQLPSINLRLDRTNYSLWRGTVCSALEAYDLDSCLNSVNTPPTTIIDQPATSTTQATTKANPAYAAWIRKDRLILLWIRSTLTTPLLGLVARATSSHEAGTMLERIFHAQTRSRQMHLRQQLQSLSKGSLSILEYFEKKRAIANSLLECLVVIPDSDFVDYLVYGLGSAYGSFRSALSLHGADLTSDALLNLLLQEEQRLEEEARETDIVTPEAHSASRLPRNHHSMDASPSQPSDRPRPMCQICKRLRHEAINCYQRLNTNTFPATGPPPRRNKQRGSQQRQQQQSAPPPPPTTFLASTSSPSTLYDPWVIDSGATHHVTGDLGKLSMSHPYDGNEGLMVGNGQSLRITHLGHSTLSALRAPNSSIHLHNILLVPDIKKNLLSVSKLSRDNNVYLEFHPHCCLVKNLQGQTLLRGTLENGLYRLPSLPQPLF
ncbi:unnamed protein product [Cuscuta epithymum]|uniref:Retrovirus-related Pol polyprotein from transposon TNT 1-94-like beta-barrel domain-containing protein n=1 Tax=Cuscuta epithymum TaxID=186058 RepID=A0AAV0DN88_9ASTE|nr:unnamed protein product [Cuscuta epithymum]